MEQLYVFGTGNAAVTRCYNTCFAIKNPNNEYFMVDTGGGNGILGILEDMKVDMGAIHHIFITHEHTDHILGIIWMIRMIATRMKKEQYHGELMIYCHPDLTATIQTICRLTLQEKFYQMIGKRIRLIAVSNQETRQILNYPVTFFDIHSAKTKQFGFSLYLENKKKLSFAGDEPYHPLCCDYFQNCDWMLHEAFCLYSQRDVFQPYEKHHSTVKDSCKLAQSLNAANLILWHTEDRNLPERKQLYRSEGQSFFKGNLYIPDDQEIIDL